MLKTLFSKVGGNPFFIRIFLNASELVKGEGSQVGFVTSARGLTKDRVAELAQAGLDFLGFSISGTTQETHDAIRVNSHLPEILDAIQFFNEEKLRRGLDRPKIHFVFLMVKDNVHEVPSVPSFAKNAGIEEVVLINICHVINAWQEGQRIFNWGEGRIYVKKL
jgi:MoaA/NifB/PqqE/SkfB family radical SAM enzyme